MAAIKTRFWRAVRIFIAAALFVSVYNFTIVPGVIKAIDAVVFALLFWLALTGEGMEESIFCCIAIVLYRRYIGASEGYMLPVELCVNVLSVTVAYWVRNVRWVVSFPVLVGMYGATLIAGTALANFLVSRVPFKEAVRLGFWDQLPVMASAVAGLLAASLLQKWAIARRKGAVKPSGG